MQEIKFLNRFLQPYWGKSFLSLVLLIIVVVFDLAIPRLVQRLIDQGILTENMQEVWLTFLLMLAISFINTLFALGNNYYSVQVGEGMARDLREALFVKIQKLSFGNLDRLKTGRLLVLLTGDVNVLQRMVLVTLRIGTRAPLIMIGSIVLMFITSPGLAMTLVPLFLISLLIIVYFILKMGPLFLTMQEKFDRLNTILHENISGMRVVKSFARADFESVRFEGANLDYTERNIRAIKFM
ncbi:MAG: ABC transporter ATP-binding protein, partial [Desulfobulbaceae bacterium]|nr:ABC transporter ATP-binding protein [Desulfobulbaceae bacterium]